MFGADTFADKLCVAIAKKRSILCCGLDPQLKYMPPHLMYIAVSKFGRTTEAIGQLFFQFNKEIIDAVCELVVCVKPQLAFYEAYGSHGVRAFERTVEYAKSMGLLVIADGKRNDGGDSADAYADGYLGEVPFFGPDNNLLALEKKVSPVRSDCLTVTPYIGDDCVCRFVERVKQNGTGIFVVTKTSFKPNSRVEQLVTETGRPVWQRIAFMAKEWGEGTEGACGLRNVGVVIGATYPDDASIMRTILPNSFFLKPGCGGQGASAEDSVIGILENGFGIIVNNSRNLTFAWQNQKGKFQSEPEKFAEAARLQANENRDELAEACKKAGKWSF